MKVEHGSHTCEHCGAKVSTAWVCPCCGREHSDLWIATAKKADGAIVFMGMFVFPYMIFKLIAICNLPFFQFMDELVKVTLNSMGIAIIAGIAYVILFGFTPKEKDIEAVRKNPTA
jgi:hypothetical protein